MSARTERTAGFTLLEVMIVASVLIPLLLVVGTATKGVVGAIGAEDRSAETNTAALHAMAEVERVLLHGRLGTLRVEATSADVSAGRAAEVGDWCTMPQRDARPAIELQSLTGDREFALKLPQQLCCLHFVPEAGEPDNNRDDDGDGLIDEGELWCTRGDAKTRLLTRVELCAFELQRDAVRVTLRYGRDGHGEAIRRTTLHYVVVPRNQ